MKRGGREKNESYYRWVGVRWSSKLSPTTDIMQRRNSTFNIFGIKTVLSHVYINVCPATTTLHRMFRPPIPRPQHTHAPLLCLVRLLSTPSSPRSFVCGNHGIRGSAGGSDADGDWWDCYGRRGGGRGRREGGKGGWSGIRTRNSSGWGRAIDR